MNYVLWFVHEGPLLALLIGVALAYVEYELIHRALFVDAVMGVTELYAIHMTLSEQGELDV